MKWNLIWQSDEYKADIYDNCTKRVYEGDDDTDPEKLKIEVDGTRWVGTTGGFHIDKFYAVSKALRAIIKQFNEDEASAQDVADAIDQLI